MCVTFLRTSHTAKLPPFVPVIYRLAIDVLQFKLVGGGGLERAC